MAPTTHEPTKKYEPSPDDDETGEEGGQKTTSQRNGVVLWSLFCLVFVAIVVYFRDPIIFFLGTVSTDLCDAPFFLAIHYAQELVFGSCCFFI